MKSTPDIQVALVGLGHVARHQVAAIGQTPGLRLAAACDIEPGCVMQLPGSVEFYTRFDRLVSDSRYDLLLISTPNRQHHLHARWAIDAGKALVLEKPAAETRDQFGDIVQAAFRDDVFLHFSLHAAFGAEVLWLARELPRGSLNLGELRGFRANFYDPYVIEGRLAPGAASLGGSWMDSGVNALSVLGRFADLQDLRVRSSRMQSPGQLDCSELEGVVELESDRIEGAIHTSWLTGENHKSTRLLFENDEILLDHSRQKAYRGPAGSRQLIYSYDGPLHRLTNHYVGVFSDLVGHYAANRGNTDYASLVHRAFFDADELRLQDKRVVIGGAPV